MDIKPCYNCRTDDNIWQIKCLSGGYLVKCENCMVEEDGRHHHPMEDGDTMDQAINNWNAKYAD
jgi:hypothetical protein